MSFAECLYEYMEKSNLNASELSGLSEISPSTIGRYLKSEQLPGENILQKLAEAFSGVLDESYEEIFASLYSAATGIHIDYESLIGNLKKLLEVLDINNNELARALYVDPSYISRILSANRRPSNIPQFVESVSHYIAQKTFDTPKANSFLSLIEADEKIETAADYSALILNYLGKKNATETPRISHFIGALDSFDLNDFMKSINFEGMKVPTLPFQLPGSKTYQGIKEIMEAELDFMKFAVLSKSKQDIIMYSDMPLEEMSKDPDFTKKWMFGMALLLRKGLHLHNIHDVHRPTSEMLLGLENWIPMYMTGQVHPYYLKEPTNHTFMHFIRSAGSVAISGEAIFGKQGNGRYVVSKNREDVKYYRRRAEDLLNRALPLMDIYREQKKIELLSDLKDFLQSGGSYRSIGSAPPLFTMSEKLLNKILKRAASENNSDLIKKEMEEIISYHKEVSAMMTKKKVSFTWNAEIPVINESELSASKEHSIKLPISPLFPEADIRYTKEEYLAHVSEATRYAETHDNFNLAINSYTPFRNMIITIRYGKQVLVSKSNTPAIHFMIHHPKVVRAFEQFIPAQR